jgi:hypothetical protein
VSVFSRLVCPYFGSSSLLSVQHAVTAPAGIQGVTEGTDQTSVGCFSC